MTSLVPDDAGPDGRASLEARAAALAKAHPGTDAESAAQALAWVDGAPLARTRGLGALASLPPGAALEAVGLGHLPAAIRPEAKRLVLAALGADPFRSPERPLSPSAEARALAGGLANEADEARAPEISALPPRGPGALPLPPSVAGARLGGDRPFCLLARAGGLEALGGLFALPPVLAPAPDDALLALEPGLRALLLRVDALGVEVLREIAAPGAESAAWHPELGPVFLGRDGALADESGRVLARTGVLPPARLIVAGAEIYVHGRQDLHLRKVDPDGRARSAMEESAAAVAIGPGGKVVALLRAPRAKVPGKKVPSHRLARFSAHGPETIGAIDGEGEVALLGELAFHVAREDGLLTIADLAAGGIRRVGRLAGAEGTTSLVATRRALYVAGTRGGHVQAYGPAAVDPAPRLAPEGAPPAGALVPVAVPDEIVALAGRMAILRSGEVLRVRGAEEDGLGPAAAGGGLSWADAGSGPSGEASGVSFAPASPPIHLGRAVKCAAPTPEGGLVAVPADGSPLIEVTAGGTVHPLPFPSTRVVGAVRFGRALLAVATSDGDLAWIDLRRGVVAELRFTALRALAPIGRSDLLVLHEGGLERLTAPGAGTLVHGGSPPLRAVGGGASLALAAESGLLLAYATDGGRRAERRHATVREPMLAALSGRSALIVPKGGGTEGLLWTL
jgi:hypothetical protein